MAHGTSQRIAMLQSLPEGQDASHPNLPFDALGRDCRGWRSSLAHVIPGQCAVFEVLERYLHAEKLGNIVGIGGRCACLHLLLVLRHNGSDVAWHLQPVAVALPSQHPPCREGAPQPLSIVIWRLAVVQVSNDEGGNCCAADWWLRSRHRWPHKG